MARFVRERNSSPTVKNRGRAVVCRDATGHIDPNHQVRLRLIARLSHNADQDPTSVHAFVVGSRTGEMLSEELAESFLVSATSGEDSELERLDRVTITEELEPYTLALEESQLAAEDTDSNASIEFPTLR